MSHEPAEPADHVARRIAAKLADLAVLRPAIGDTGVPLVIEERLDDAGLAAVEARLGVALPDSYRALARHVGTRGAGPDYGLCGLDEPMPAEMPQVTATVTTVDGETLSAGTGARPPLAGAPSPARPFPLAAAWRPFGGDGAAQPLPVPDGAHLYDGAVMLGEIGCGYFYFLVVAGPRAGEVWVDYTAGDGAIAPVEPLLDWYERWVDDWMVATLTAALRGAMPPGRDDDAPRDHDAIVARWGHVLEQRGEAAGAPGAALGDLALWRLYQGRLDEVDRLLAALEALPADEADRLPPSMVEALTTWRHVDAMRAARARPPEIELAVTHPAWRVRRALADNPDTPPDALARLARDPRAEIRFAVASHPRADATALRALVDAAAATWATDPEDRDALFVLDLVARHPGAGDALLDQLARWDEAWPEVATAPWIVRGVAMNLATPPALVARLAEHPHPCVREAVARGPHVELLAALARDPDPAVRIAVARNPATPEPVLLALADDADPDVRFPLAERRPLAPALAARLATDDSSSVQITLGYRRDLDASTVEVLRRYPAGSVQRRLDDEAAAAGKGVEASAGAPVTAPELAVDLELFGSGETGRPPMLDPRLERRPRAALATIVTGRAFGNPGYPVPRMRRYVDDPDVMIAYGMASHPWLDDDLLRALAGASYAYTRASIARRPALPGDVLARLLDDPSELVIEPALARPDVPADTLARRARDPRPEARTGVAMNPAAPAGVLAQLATDADVRVRCGVAGNPAAPAPAREALLADADPIVRRAVARCPHTPAALLERLAGDDDAEVRAWLTWRRLRDAARR